MAVHVRSIEIEGFKSIGHARLDLGDLNVLIGAGKSNFVRSYSFVLARAADEELVFTSEMVTAGSHVQASTARQPPDSLGQGQRESRLHDPSIPVAAPAAAAVVRLLGGCRVYHFHDTSHDAPVKT